VLIKGDINSGAPVLTRMHTLTPAGGRGGPWAAARRSLARRCASSRPRGAACSSFCATPHEDASDSEHSPQTLRQYGLGAQILVSLGLHELILLTNSPQPKVVGLEAIPDHHRHAPDHGVTHGWL
jgi:3,4-dihydroxy 2-butanone 4-phosphate synthase / GTP cyclohydrolase II